MTYGTQKRVTERLRNAFVQGMLLTDSYRNIKIQHVSMGDKLLGWMFCVGVSNEMGDMVITYTLYIYM